MQSYFILTKKLYHVITSDWSNFINRKSGMLFHKSYHYCRLIHTVSWVICEIERNKIISRWIIEYEYARKKFLRIFILFKAIRMIYICIYTYIFFLLLKLKIPCVMNKIQCLIYYLCYSHLRVLKFTHKSVSNYIYLSMCIIRKHSLSAHF